MNRSVRCGIWLAAALGVAFLVGCDSKKDSRPRIDVKGRLSKDGRPFTFDEAKIKLPAGAHGTPPVAEGAGGGLIDVAFISTEGNDVTYAQVDTNAGTFQVKGIVPGRYKIALTVKSLMPGMTDPFEGKFTPQKTKIIRDVEEGRDIDIDIAKPQG